jgi:hypothetical protein
MTVRQRRIHPAPQRHRSGTAQASKEALSSLSWQVTLGLGACSLALLAAAPASGGYAGHVLPVMLHNLEAAGAYCAPILAYRKAKKSLTCSLRFFMTWST